METPNRESAEGLHLLRNRCMLQQSKISGRNDAFWPSAGRLRVRLNGVFTRGQLDFPIVHVRPKAAYSTSARSYAKSIDRRIKCAGVR